MYFRFPSSITPCVHVQALDIIKYRLLTYNRIANAPRQPEACACARAGEMDTPGRLVGNFTDARLGPMIIWS